MRNIMWAILACFLWSTAFAGIKIGLRYMPPLGFAGIRFMISGLLLLPFCGGLALFFRTVCSHFRTILLIAALQTFFVYALFYTGMTMVDGAIAAILIGSAPLISATLAHYLMHDDRFTPGKLISLLIGIGGIAIIALSRQPWLAVGRSEFFGVLILLLSSVVGNTGNIFVARERNSIPPLILNSAQIFVGGLGLFLVSLVMEGVPDLHQPLEFYAALLWLAMLSAVAFSIWFTLLKKPGVRVSELNLWKFIIPVFGALLSWLVLPQESPEWSAIIGMVFVAGSILSFHLCLLERNCDK